MKSFICVALSLLCMSAYAQFKEHSQRPAVQISTSVGGAQTTVVWVSSAAFQFGCVAVSSNALAGSVTVYDSSDTATTGKQILLGVQTSSLGTYCSQESVDLGITYDAKTSSTFLLLAYPTPQIGGTR